ncbi:MAG: undecaprenyldiphospho-muramoylpentapeptide beta-N-acetylglucosaminyltransferase [bacterium]
MKTIIVSGGTGGHIYPGIAIAEEIRSRDPKTEILFIGSEEGLEKELVPKAGFDIKLIKARALLRKLSYKAISAPFVSAFGFFQALSIIKAFKPQALISTGGYASLTSVVAAKILNVPVYIHEQNVLPGITNKLCFRFANKIFLTYKESLAFHSGLVVGNPIRKEILATNKETAKKELAIPAGKKVLLIMGGSQGSRQINQTILGSLPKLAGSDWYIIHLIGKRDYPQIMEPETESLGSIGKTKGTANFIRRLKDCPFYRPVDYLYNVGEAVAASDLVVSRAGATAIAEFTASGLPMILVPFPFSAEGHQDLNAAVVAKAGAGIVIKNNDFVPDVFVAKLKELENKLVGMGKAAKTLAKPDAAKKIVDNINEKA